MQHFNFSPHILVLHGQSVLQFLIQLFSLAKRCAQAWNTFGCIWAKQQCQKCKCGKMEVRRIQIIFILPSHKVAVSQYMNYTYKKLQIFFLTLETRFTLLQIFSYACKFNLRLLSYVHFHKSYPAHANLLGIILSSYWRKTGEAQNPVQCEVSAVCDDLECCDVCWCWSIVFYQVQSQCSRLPGDFGELYASICWQALWICWFPFPAGL